MLATLAEQRLNDLAHVLLLDPRAIQRVIKAHRDATGAVPHGRCYAIRREELGSITDKVAVNLPPESARPWLLLVARPSAQESEEDPEEALERVVRAAFHALVHATLERRQSEGLLDDAAVRERVRCIGKTEFEEIRAAFTHDDQLLPPAADRDVYIEFCATYLELREFCPALLVTTFPGLDDQDHIDSVLAGDVDVDTLLRTSRAPRRGSTPAARPPSEAPPPAAPPVPKRVARRLLNRARRARERGLLARAAMLSTEASSVDDPELRAQATAAFESVLRRLSTQLEAALRGASPHDPQQVAGWYDTLERLCKRRPRQQGIGRSPEDRVLLALEHAVCAFEQPGVIVDVPSWLLSFGRRALVRPRDTARELQVARCIDVAAERARSVRLSSAERVKVTEWLESASRRAETNIRQALRPAIRDVLARVGLTPNSGPEQQARAKLVEELLDQVVERGFLSLPQLRDTVSRNDAKLGDVTAREALLSGDSLLRADAQLDLVLDGIYQRGDVYVRGLQKASSLSFGNRFGRAMSLYLALPALGAFIVLEGLRHLVSPLLVWLGFDAIEPMGFLSFALTSGCILALLHSPPFRLFARQALDVLGVGLAWIFLRLPRALLRRPVVRRWLARPGVRGFIRRAVVPAALSGLAFVALPLRLAPLVPLSEEQVRAGVALSVFVLASMTMTSRIGWWLENVFVDRIAPTWQALSRQWIPQVVRLVGRAFRVAMDGFERTIRNIENALRFRRTRSPVTLAVAGAVGLLWAMVAYVVRLYVTLLVEPEINPLKHFPVVTVAHKLILPFLPEMLAALEQTLNFLGPILGGTIAGVTVFLLPSVFGFLAWELKENYRLYRATRTEFVSEARLGPDGETMHGLLVPGIHSGTLPKLYDRLRRAAQRREEHNAKQGLRSGSLLTPELSPELGRFRERLHAIEKAVRRFAERELLPALAITPASMLSTVRITRVDLSSNRVRIQVACPDAGHEPCELTFEHLAGWVVARVSQAGFVRNLDLEQATLFENALAVFYHRAEVALVREQIAAELGSEVHYDFVEDGIVVYPGESYETELCYQLRQYRPRVVLPALRGKWQAGAPALDTRRVVFAHQQVAWPSWEQAWAAARSEQGASRRLLIGPSILPRSE